jgi:hypothetical protein
LAWHVGQLIVLSITVFSSTSADAFTPIECVDGQSVSDFAESPLIMIGRVVGIERFKSEVSGHQPKEDYFYLATISIGKVLKGDAKADDNILFFMGFSYGAEGDNVRARRVVVANNHPGWPLEIDASYLICLRRSRYLEQTEIASAKVLRDGEWQAVPKLKRKDIWEPRSCHASIHRIISTHEPLKVSLSMPLSICDHDKTLPLEEFITLASKPLSSTMRPAPANEGGKTPRAASRHTGN